MPLVITVSIYKANLLQGSETKHLKIMQNVVSAHGDIQFVGWPCKCLSAWISTKWWGNHPNSNNLLEEEYKEEYIHAPYKSIK